MVMMAKGKTGKNDDGVPQRRNGFYYIDEKRIYPSVTTVLQVIAKPGLIYWAARTAARAALANPLMSEDQAISAIYQEKAKGTDRGQAIHNFIEAFRTGKKVNVKSMPKEHRGYAIAFMKFVQVFKPKSMPVRRTVWSDKYEIAGTLDDLMTFHDKKGKVWLVDFKTGKDIYPEAGLQLVAYKTAVEEQRIAKIDATAILLLKEDGDFALEEMNGSLEAFIAAKRLWIWANQEKYDQRFGPVEVPVGDDLESLCAEGEAEMNREIEAFIAADEPKVAHARLRKQAKPGRKAPGAKTKAKSATKAKPGASQGQLFEGVKS
jgi:hypothetical protein